MESFHQMFERELLRSIWDGVRFSLHVFGNTSDHSIRWWKAWSAGPEKQNFWFSPCQPWRQVDAQIEKKNQQLKIWRQQNECQATGRHSSTCESMSLEKKITFIFSLGINIDNKTTGGRKTWWWLKSCTSWNGKYPNIYKVSFVSTDKLLDFLHQQ